MGGCRVRDWNQRVRKEGRKGREKEAGWVGGRGEGGGERERGRESGNLLGRKGESLRNSGEGGQIESD